MIKQIFKVTVFCLTYSLACGIPQVNSAELDDLSSNVFNFQQKLANNGNVQSQTKLGEMLEAGNGVEKNIEQARHWYQQATNAGYEPAQNRLTYLEIRNSGFDKAKHSSFVSTIKSQAQAHNRDSMLLLAQMYREGHGVEKNLNAAKQILETLSVSGNMSIDNETTLLDTEIRASQKREQEYTAKRAEQANQRAEAERVQNAQAAEKAQLDAAKAKAVLAAKEETVEDKRKRYEAVMQKLKEEERILKEQQKWAEERGN